MKERFIGKCPVCGLSGCFLTETKTGKEYSSKSYDIWYKDFLDYEDLPEAVKCEATKKEFEEYWRSQCK